MILIKNILRAVVLVGAMKLAAESITGDLEKEMVLSITAIALAFVAISSRK